MTAHPRRRTLLTTLFVAPWALWLLAFLLAMASPELGGALASLGVVASLAAWVAFGLDMLLSDRDLPIKAAWLAGLLLAQHLAAAAWLLIHVWGHADAGDAESGSSTSAPRDDRLPPSREEVKALLADLDEALARNHTAITTLDEQDAVVRELAGSELDRDAERSLEKSATKRAALQQRARDLQRARRQLVDALGTLGPDGVSHPGLGDILHNATDTARAALVQARS